MLRCNGELAEVDVDSLVVLEHGLAVLVYPKAAPVSSWFTLFQLPACSIAANSGAGGGTSSGSMLSASTSTAWR